jgi:hypothetical protein
VNGKLAASWSFEGSHARRATVDINLRETRKEIVIRFEHHHAISPAELGISDDPRRLSLFVSRLEIVERRSWLDRWKAIIERGVKRMRQDGDSGSSCRR